MKVLLTGAGGLLGAEVARRLSSEGVRVEPLGSSALDVTEADDVHRVVSESAPDQVWNCAAWTAVDLAESEEERAHRVNRDGARHVAEACRNSGALLVHFSTDFVFDGDPGRPWEPDDPPAPRSAYGRSKLAGERAVAESGADHLLVRTSALFGAGGPNFVSAVTARARSGASLRVVDDQLTRPTWSGSLCATTLELVRAGARGVFHVADRGTATWFELASAALSIQGIRAEIQGVSTAEWGAPAPRPHYSVLALEHTESLLGRRQPTWKETLKHFLEEDAA